MWVNVCDEGTSLRKNSKVISSDCPDKNLYGTIHIDMDTHLDLGLAA